MKVPAIRAQIGTWIYYVSTLTFKEVAEFVSPINNELHKSSLLSEMLQRSITSNYISIANYIEQQDERFFNALILAVYDGDPQWHEVRLEYDNGDEFYNLGILELSGKEKIFPVDGQHRVEGIRKIVSKKTTYNEERIPVVFIGHKKTEDGMQRSRRLFSTLNRYAKPVSMRDIIALDEDDSIAIASRELIDNHPLFGENRIFDSHGKALPDNNITAITSIITFYECNRELLWLYIKDKDICNIEGEKVKGISSKISEYIRIRPDDSDIQQYISLCRDFWDSFIESFSDVSSYLAAPEPNTIEYRNRDGGSVFFRPLALAAFFKAAVRVKIHRNETFREIFRLIPTQILKLNNKIWHNVLWDPELKKMIMGHKSLIPLILLYYWDRDELKQSEILKLKKELKSIRQLNDEAFVDELLADALE